MLIFCLASVIKEKTRWGYFLQLLDSIRAQTRKPEGLCISIHVDPALNITQSELQEKCWGLTHNPNNKNTHILWQGKALRQFEGYEMLMQRIPAWFADDTTTTPPWIGFTDDDDLWNKSRVALFEETLAGSETLEVASSVSSVCIPQRTEVKREACCAIASAEDVTKALVCGCVKVTFYPDPQRGLFEYVDSVVPLPVVKDFFRQNQYYDYSCCCGHQWKDS